MPNSRHARKLAQQAQIRDLNVSGLTRVEIAETVGVSKSTVDEALKFVDTDEQDCGWDTTPHYAPDHRTCRLRQINK